MLTVDQLQVMSGELDYYDVDQRGWEQEPHGLRANVNHVLMHLVKDATTKDFSSETQVRTELAPDALQHALRFRRWGMMSVQLIMPGDYETQAIKKVSQRFLGRPHHLAWLEAAAVIARNMHDGDHASERQAALAEQLIMVHCAGGLLLHSAQLSAETYSFDLATAFDERLASLRVRFGIPEPDKQLR